jgi:hypothetical protein
MFPGSVTSPFLRQPGYQACRLTRGFASPPRDGFAFIGKGSSFELVSSWARNMPTSSFLNNAPGARRANSAAFQH